MGRSLQLLAPKRRWCPGSEVRRAGISRFADFRTDKDAGKILLSSVVHGSEVRYGG
jgi:hypothetical protein